MQKWDAAENGVRRYQAVIRGTWCNARPSTARIQMGCAARGLSGVWCDDHWQFAKHSVPSVEPIRAIRSLEHFLQDRRCEPDRLSVFESFGEQLDFDQIVAA